MTTKKRNELSLPESWGVSVEPDGRDKWKAQGISYLLNGLEDRDVPRVDAEGESAPEALANLVAQLWLYENEDSFEAAWDMNVAWVVETLTDEQTGLKADNGADTTAPIWLQYDKGQFYIHTGSKPVQYGYFGLWASGAITVSSEPAAVADYLSSQIKKQIQED